MTAYKRLKDMPSEKLAANIVASLIQAEGNLNKYHAVMEHLINEMRKEYGAHDDLVNALKEAKCVINFYADGKKLHIFDTIDAALALA